jgi:P27 family predicted phage terminase small subunit
LVSHQKRGFGKWVVFVFRSPKTAEKTSQWGYHVMGSRGPLPKDRKTVIRMPETPVPAVPEGLGRDGLRAWETTWSTMPWLMPSDAATVEQLCRLHDLLARCLAEVESRGVLLEEPVRGRGRRGAPGAKVVANPAVALLLRTERVVQEVAATLGAAPQSRARLGLKLLQAEARQETMLSRLRRDRGLEPLA